MSLTGAPLTILLIVAAVALPIALALAWRRLPGRVGGAALRIGMIISCQAIAVMAAGIALNRAFLFYDSWGELLGHQGGGGQAAIAVADEGQLVPADGSQGRISILTVHGKVSGATEQVLVWLPPQYDAAGRKENQVPSPHGAAGPTWHTCRNLQDPRTWAATRCRRSNPVRSSHSSP